jgi:phosphatidylserine/phosphatidylglycerophosphate/cardiolipin synthase-like enzyme
MDGILREDITSSLISQKIDMATLGFPDAEETLPLDKVQLEKYNEDVVSKDPVFDQIIEVAEKKTTQKKSPEALISAPVIRDVDTFEHVIYLQKALKNARSRILIISPWIKGNVVNDVFISDLEDRIKKGVRVDVVYGYKNQLVRNTDEYRGSHKHALQKLYTLMKKYPQKMEIHELDDTHAKIMLFDDVVIKTSFNWLSFKGDPKRTYRFESGTYIEDPSHADDVYTQIVARLPDMKVPEPKIF